MKLGMYYEVSVLCSYCYIRFPSHVCWFQAPTQSLPDLSSPITLKHIGFATSETGGGGMFLFHSTVVALC